MKWKNDILKPISLVASNSRKNMLVSASHGSIFKWSNYMHAIFPRLSASLLNMAWISWSPIWVQNSRMELSFEFSSNLFWSLAQFSPLHKIIFDHSTVPWQDYFVKKVNYYSMYNVLSYAHVIMWGLGRFVFIGSGVHGWSWGGATKETVSRFLIACIVPIPLPFCLSPYPLPLSTPATQARFLMSKGSHVCYFFLGLKTLNLQCNLQG